MPYKNFSLKKAKDDFQLIEQEGWVIPAFSPLQASDFLIESLARGMKISLENEKVRSEVLIMPVMLELREQNGGIFGLYSGETLDADKSLGLNGECDFILSGEKTVEVSAPVFTLVEAKHNINKRHYGQCVAQMVGVQLFNKINDRPINVIFGCVSSGEEWQFLKLEGKMLTIERRKFYLNGLGDLLGALQYVVDYFKGKNVFH